MRKNIIVKTDGITEIHFISYNNSYLTLCGLDGDDDGDNLSQITIDVTTERVNCKDCIAIYDYCKKIKESDINRNTADRLSEGLI